MQGYLKFCSHSDQYMLCDLSPPKTNTSVFLNVYRVVFFCCFPSLFFLFFFLVVFVFFFVGDQHSLQKQFILSCSFDVCVCKVVSRYSIILFDVCVY